MDAAFASIAGTGLAGVATEIAELLAAAIGVLMVVRALTLGAWLARIRPYIGRRPCLALRRREVGA